MSQQNGSSASPDLSQLTPEQLAKKKAKDAAKAEKTAKFLAKKKKQEVEAKARAAKAASGGGGGGGASTSSSAAAAKAKKAAKSDGPVRLKQKFINTTPKGEKKDMSEPMAAAYDPPAVEAAWYDWWEKQGFFAPSEKPPPPVAADDDEQNRFVIVIPPPNVTGWLHLGHALTNAVQDTLVRWHRMRGADTLWVPGMDHAGIATQRVVERVLWKEHKQTRHDLGRAEFVKRVWQWKEDYGGKIVSQLRRMGSSVDWKREVFTMDDKLSRAVTHSFVHYFDQGLIYRANRLVNYCCELETAISDIEVDHVEVPTPTRMKVPGHPAEKAYEFGKLWLFAYKLADDDTQEIVVATTRPETMLGDTAVAVHPDDERYKAFVGKRVRHPFCAQPVIVVADTTLVKMEFGTGAVKVTPAHDPNDYACGQRHQLPMIEIYTASGRINERVCARFGGMPRFEAREAVLAALKEAGLYRGEEASAMTIPVCSRTKDIIEPMLCPQWYLNCDSMARRAADAVRNKELEIVPAFHEHTWFHYLDNIRDWCISRQLWWGHRVPAYRVVIDGVDVAEDIDGGGDGDGARPATKAWVAAASEAEAVAKAAALHGIAGDAEIARRVCVRQDEDVLDTWYSSGLFPFSVFGWPDDTADLARFFPTSVLETGHDILFFWVARMVMMSLSLTDKLPFKRVLLHAMVRDAHNRKMSKSKGNVIDPVWVVEGITLDALHRTLLDGNLPPEEIKMATAGQKADFPRGIPECGVDALRFGLCAYTMQGRDINLDVNRVAAYRNFCNKLWNAVRFALANLEDASGGAFVPLAAPAAAADALCLVEERWILSRLASTIDVVDRGLRAFQMGEATSALHSFFQYDFCDFFLEAIKPYMRGDETTATAATRASVRETLYTCLDVSLRLLHPFMPFVTEELWQRLTRRPSPSPPPSIICAAYPTAVAWWRDEAAEADVRAAQDVIGVIRSERGAYMLTRKDQPAARVRVANETTAARLRPLTTAIAELATLGDVAVEVAAAGASAALPRGNVALRVDDDKNVWLGIGDLVDVEKLKASLGARLQKLQADAASLAKRRGTANYAKVPADVQARDEAKAQAYADEEALILKTLKSIETFKKE